MSFSFLGPLLQHFSQYFDDWSPHWSGDWGTKVYTTGGQAWTLTSGSDKALFKEWASAINAGGGSDTITLEKGAGKVDLGGTGEYWTTNTLNLKGGWDNILTGSNGKDIINIADGTGLDTGQLYGGNDVVNSKGWISQLDAGSGDDCVTLDGQGGAEIKLGDGNDSASARGFVTYLDAGTGNDKVGLYGGAGYTDLGDGNDSVATGDKWAGDISGGNGDDRFDIGAGANVYAGCGNDVAYDDRDGTTRFYGDDGNDTFVWDESAADWDLFDGGAGSDKLVVDLDWCGPSKADILKEFGLCASWSNTYAIDTGSKMTSTKLNIDLQGVEYIQFA